jgi:DNA-binding transcriptional ArsR family regulator
VSPLEALSAASRATDAFELLSNETRLAILVALWEAYEPFDESNGVRFSELRSRVGTVDSGQFNYHLDRLESHFVESTDGGYTLSEAGLKFVRSVIAGTGVEAPEVERTEVDTACTLCGGGVEIDFEDGWLFVVCSDCDGVWLQGDDGRRSGHLAMFSLDPAGLQDRSPEEVYAAAWVRTFQRLYSMIERVCPTCSGRVERSLDVCTDHVEGECPHCDRRDRTIARLRCTVCKEWAVTTVGGIAKYHPAVVGFCYDRGLELQYGFNDLDAIQQRLRRANSVVEHRSEDPPRIRVTTELDGDEFWLELDEDLSVVAVER